jgi:hypothetical protein
MSKVGSSGADSKTPQAIAWCSLPFPQYPLTDDEKPPGNPLDPSRGSKSPGHGETRVHISFWFFLFVYYGFYSLTALVWITKVFNLYSLNWSAPSTIYAHVVFSLDSLANTILACRWPQTLGFPLTFSLLAALSIAVPIPVYYIDATRFLTLHNTSWIAWTFVIMAMPVAIAFLILTNNERHIGLRNSLSETQRIFTTSWWTTDTDTLSRPDRRRPNVSADLFDGYEVGFTAPAAYQPRTRGVVAIRRRWLPASFVRFLWFCVALFIGLMAYVLGEAYAELYLKTLPHDSFETVVYVYGWVITVHLLDALTGFVLGIREGERVGSYPLSWVFKLYAHQAPFPPKLLSSVGELS